MSALHGRHLVHCITSLGKLSNITLEIIPAVTREVSCETWLGYTPGIGIIHSHLVITTIGVHGAWHGECEGSCVHTVVKAFGSPSLRIDYNVVSGKPSSHMPSYAELL